MEVRVLCSDCALRRIFIRPFQQEREATEISHETSLDHKAVFHLSIKPVSDSVLKPVSVCLYTYCGRFGFGADTLTTRVKSFPFPLNASAKTFTLYSCVPDNVHTQNYTDSTICTTRLYNNLLTEKSTWIHYWTPPSWFHAVNRLETSSQGLIRTGFGFANGMRNPMNPKPVSVSVWQTEYALNLNFASLTVFIQVVHCLTGNRHAFQSKMIRVGVAGGG